MIFSDQTTADRYRKRAATQLNEDILRLAEKLLSHADMINAKDPDSRAALLESVIDQHLTEGTGRRIWKTLLYRSGIILSDTSDDTYDSIVLYYDRDYDDGFPVTNAMRTNGLTGGINSETGQIHT